MEEEEVLTLSDRALELAIAVPDTPPYQFLAGLILGLFLMGLVYALKSLRPENRSARGSKKPSEQRVRLSGEELREVRAQRLDRNGRA